MTETYAKDEAVFLNQVRAFVAGRSFAEHPPMGRAGRFSRRHMAKAGRARDAGSDVAARKRAVAAFLCSAFARRSGKSPRATPRWL